MQKSSPLRITSVIDLLKLLDRSKLSGESVVFRGQSKNDPLVPAIGREPFLLQGRDGYDNWIDFETDLLDQFRKHAYPYLGARSHSDWEWMFIARHYGLPTRLLDWTTNPLKGLFFAVSNFREDHQDGVFWAIETAGWMESMEGKERSTLRDMVLTYPSHIDGRIVAQDGCFTVFPLPPARKKFRPANKERLVRRSIKIRIPARARADIRSELDGLGVSPGTVFPGLDGAVATIRQRFGEGWLT
jgi:hypothetical protein